MAYTVLARRYRSQDFDEVIGQEPIARTLQRAIESDRIAHAYLFTGTRGVGKTSMARIFAKAINATDDLENQAEIATAIMQGEDIDVIEIDGASNRGVDEARELIANSIYRPARSPYKVYIIDEVHMLTREAFNALLKTMEEPPEHVKFILCTTEPHKVPQTIQSRCQRFDFRAIPTPRIAEHLREVLKQEKVKADDSVVQQVARLGAGSMRDALSLLDRLLASGEKKLTDELLEQMLGLPDRALVEGVIDAIADNDAAASLEKVNELFARGISLDQLIESLVEDIRNLMLVAACGTADLESIELSADDRARVTERAKRFDAPALVHMIVLLENVQRAVRASSTGRALFEAAIIRLAQSAKFADAAALLRGESSSASSPAPKQKKKPVSARAEASEPPPPRPASPKRSVATTQTPATPSPAAPVSTADIDHAALWAAVSARVEAEMPSLHSVLEHARLVEVAGDVVTLATDDSKIEAAIRAREERLRAAVQAEIGRPVRLAYRSGAEMKETPPTPVISTNPAVTAKAREEAAKIPLVKQAMDILDARIIEVKDDGA
ncbi:MAG: DNA polymerase III subunit gamma/tau [Phycisphaerales bacterium]